MSNPLHPRRPRAGAAARKPADPRDAVERAGRRAVRALPGQRWAEADRPRRRGAGRGGFARLVWVVAEDGESFTLLGRNLSATGIHLVGRRWLLGQTLRVMIPRPGGTPPWHFLVRVLWTRGDGDGSFENGGAFLGLAR